MNNCLYSCVSVIALYKPLANSNRLVIESKLKTHSIASHRDRGLWRDLQERHKPCALTNYLLKTITYKRSKISVYTLLDFCLRLPLCLSLSPSISSSVSFVAFFFPSVTFYVLVFLRCFNACLTALLSAWCITLM